MTELLVVGCDGLEPDHGRRASLFDGRGMDVVSADSPPDMEDMSMPWTGQAWPSIYCGNLDHGITEKSTLRRDGCPDFSTFPSTVFDDLSYSYDVASFAMPITFPAGHVSGWMVSGFPASRTTHGVSNDENLADPSPRSFYNCSPPDGFHDVRFGQIDNLYSMGSFEDLCETMISTRERRFSYFCDMYNDEDVVFYGTHLPDWAVHRYWYLLRQDEITDDFENTELFSKTYDHIARLLDALETIVEPEETIVVSDHGTGGNTHPHTRNATYASTDSTSVDSIYDFREQISETAGVSLAEERYGTSIDGATAAERAEIEEQLKSLGYLE